MTNSNNTLSFRNENIIKQTVGSLKSDYINPCAVEKVERFLPELEEKTRAFDRRNSQTTLSLMTLTMMNGHSKYRLLRQVLAETEKKKGALAEAQVNHAKTLKRLEDLKDLTDSISKAEYLKTSLDIVEIECKMNGAFKDLAILIDAYLNIKEKHNIKDWDEKAFEAEEKQFHVRRAFELMYRNLLVSGRPAESTIEYCQQFGIHPQVCFRETGTYLASVDDKLVKSNNPHANDLEDFLDSMAEKYKNNVDETAKRLFGKADFTNSDYMYQMMKETVRN